MTSAATARTPGAPALPAAGRAAIDRALVKAHIIAGFTFFFVALFAGLLYALQLSRIYPFPGVEILSPGRVRIIHTNAVAFGFLLNLFFAVLHWVIPRLTGRPVLSKKLSWALLWGWQLIVLAAAVGDSLGEAQAIEWGETPVWLDPFVVVAVAAMVTNLMTPIIRARKSKMYVTLWYFTAMLVWTPLVYVMGNFIPQYFVPGAGGAAVTGLYIHDLVGLSVTPLGWGAMYYFVPVVLKKPIWSHTLSLIGFWGLAFFYPLNGVHHFFFSPIPMYAQYGAVISTIAVEIVVFTVIVNFFMTIRGKSDMVRSNMTIRWFYTGMVCYFITCLQCAFHTTLTFQKIIHFTDWVVGHAHLVMFGVFGFWMIGVTVYLWPRLVKRDWWSAKLNSWAYWLCTLGLLIMFIDLMAAGLVQGYLWKDLAPWESSIVASKPFWHVRSFAGTMIVAGVMVQAYNMWMTARQPAEESLPEPAQAAA